MKANSYPKGHKGKIFSHSPSGKSQMKTKIGSLPNEKQ